MGAEFAGIRPVDRRCMDSNQDLPWLRHRFRDVSDLDDIRRTVTGDDGRFHGALFPLGAALRIRASCPSLNRLITSSVDRARESFPAGSTSSVTGYTRKNRSSEPPHVPDPFQKWRSNALAHTATNWNGARGGVAPGFEYA